jgi:2-keto-4-pentenoate hydratase/2-oxohepta-3-ene-1,7-dioic acid hydratase in catechol pathway
MLADHRDFFTVGKERRRRTAVDCGTRDPPPDHGTRLSVMHAPSLEVECRQPPAKRAPKHDREDDMTQDRRTFLKAATLAGAAAAASAVAASSSPALAQTAARRGSEHMPRGLIFATLKRDAGYGLGLRTERGILDVAAAEKDFHENAPTTIDAVFRGEGDTDGLKRLVDKAGASASAAQYFVPADKATFGPCVTNPEKIVCIGLNYRRHAAETGNPVPKMPILFNKFNTALNNHGGTIGVSEEDARNFDYEAELVIVIGRTARSVSEADAGNYIFGYCAGNDFTARDLQSRSSQWMLGKALDGSGPLGPWLVTADQVDGDNLKIECRVNGKVVQSSNTSDMVFNCRQLVSYVSRYMTLKPGDVIFTGTPEGVIAGKKKDEQVWLKAGDKVVTSIEKLGDLEFTLT